jgi:hypothetical protein
MKEVWFDWWKDDVYVHGSTVTNLNAVVMEYQIWLVDV